MLTQFTGRGPVSPPPANLFTFGNMLIDATTEKAAFVGRVWWPGGRAGATANIRRLGWRFGTVSKAAGSGLVASLQDVSLTVGPPIQPDGVQDQTVAIANGDAGFASNLWYRSGALSADRLVTYGDRLAVVIEFNAGGRVSPDAINISTQAVTIAFNTAGSVLFTTAVGWSFQNAFSNIVLEFDDGTFGTLDDSYVSAAGNTHLFNSGSAPDEYAVAFEVDVPCTIDALWASIAVAAGADCELVLYNGTTPMATVSIDANAVGSALARPILEPIVEQTLLPGTTYYIGVRPTTANNVSVFSIDVADANHFTLHELGPAFNYSTRTDQGAWAARTTTRRLIAGVRFSGFADGNGMIMSRVRSGF